MTTTKAPKLDFSSMRLIDERRRRSVTRPLTDEARAVREKFCEKGSFVPKEIATLDRYRKELAEGAYTVSWVCELREHRLGDGNVDAVYVGATHDGGVELYRRRATAAERTLPLPFMERGYGLTG